MNVDLSWMDRIACAGMDPALFFARSGKYEVAEMVCAKCPVQEQCSAWAGDATVAARTEAQAAPERRSRHHGGAERNRAGAENHPQRKGSRMSEVETSDPLRAAADLLAWNLDKLKAAEEAAGTFPSPAFWEWNSVGYAIQAALDEREPKS